MLCPYSNLNEIGEKFILQLVEKVHLIILRNQENQNLINCFKDLNLTKNVLYSVEILSDKIIDFYEKLQIIN